MKLSDRLSNAAEDVRLCGFEIRPGTLDAWEVLAQNLEADRRAAWRSFYIASAVVGLLIAFAVWQRFELQPTPPATPATNVMQLDPMTIRDRSAETIEI